MKFIFEQIRVGGDRNFAYLIGDRANSIGVVVDPSYNPETVIERAKKQNLSIKYIINTHSHSDHINGNEVAQKLTLAKIAAYSESPIMPDVKLNDGDTLQIGSIAIQVIWTPGHCPDHIVLHIPEFGLALTGDHLFIGKIGGTLTEEAAEQQFRSLQKICRVLPPPTTIWPGHDVGCRPSSTMAWERISNPFLLAKDMPAFMQLKISWPNYKQELGLM